ncbi:parathyroid hormone/parathyroid hormone-related peptide receptor-like [Haliotis cracherodii]|uniref:parathyroid hormone/parathyroid hormone-related peptide receptor-like n=1 Tax=Haliotis cracherodii TaxID=6455 RepID=UPI0039EA80FA
MNMAIFLPSSILCSSVLLFVLTLPNSVTMTATMDDPASKQRFRLVMANITCQKRIANTSVPSTGIHCNMTFDKIMCWPYTPAGTVARQPCADYVNNFITTAFATRRCMEDGSWWFNPKENKTWSNYTACVPGPLKQVDPLIKEHIEIVMLISRLGYSISLAILLLAIVLMLIFRRLHCQRNILHVNLFVSFALRAMLCLLKEMVQGTGTDVESRHAGTSPTVQETHWECKLLFTLLHYALGANYMWIFVEGLYLHTLIILAVFSHKRVFKWYILLGWLTPLLFVIPWVIVRIYLGDTLCWNTHEGGYYWILKAPIIASIFVNFFFFINIIRVLFTKLMANNARDPRRYRKLAKSTLVLIPLFGVHYIIFIIIPDEVAPQLKLIKFYTETIFNSFQGVIVAFLFCFLNGEVRAEIKKKWVRHRLRNDNSLCSGRSSRAYSSASFFTRYRGSLTQNIAMSDICQSVTSINNANGDVTQDNDDTTIQNGTTNTDGEKQCSLDGNDVANLSRIPEELEENTPMLFQNGVS